MYWGRPWFEVREGTTPMKPVSVDLTVRQKLGLNTLMFAHVQYPWQEAKNPLMLREDTLMSVKWGVKPDELTTWYGYIHHGELDTAMPERQGTVKLSYTMIGTGHILADARTKVYRNITDSGVALEIAKSNNLSAVVHKTTKKYPYLYQPGISDYAWLTERGNRAGRKFWVENGVLYFVDIAVWAAAKKAFEPEFEIHKDLARPLDSLRFQATVGGDMPVIGRQLNRKIHGVDHQSGKRIERNQRDAQSARTQVVAGSMVDAMADTEYQLSGATNKGQEWVSASATVNGSINLEPGQPVQFKGSALPEHLRGSWLVVGAEHHLRGIGVNNMGQTKFSTYIELARNARDQYNYKDKNVPQIDDACVSGGGQWRARNIRQVIL